MPNIDRYVLCLFSQPFISRKTHNSEIINLGNCIIGVWSVIICYSATSRLCLFCDRCTQKYLAAAQLSHCERFLHRQCNEATIAYTNHWCVLFAWRLFHRVTDYASHIIACNNVESVILFFILPVMYMQQFVNIPKLNYP